MAVTSAIAQWFLLNAIILLKNGNGNSFLDFLFTYFDFIVIIKEKGCAEMDHKEYVRIVEGSKNAVLMIHGIAGSPAHFRELLPVVPENW